MLNERIYLTPQEILEKDFKIDARGYRPQEVDKFLDMVIRDYAEYNSIIKKCENEINMLRADNEKLKTELRKIRDDIESRPETRSQNQVSNVDLLRRLSQLEKAVFGSDE